MIDIIGIIAGAAHWCVSCANDGNVLPPGLGILGGAAGAAGGMGALAPMSDLYPPGTTTDADGNLTWTNPDGTTSTKGPDATVTTSPGGGPSTVRYPDGLTDPDEEMRKTIGEIPPVVQEGGPNTLDEAISAVGMVEGVTGGGLVTSGGLMTAGGLQNPYPIPENEPFGKTFLGLLGEEGAQDTAKDALARGQEAAQAASDAADAARAAEAAKEAADPPHPHEDDPPDATVPDATVGNTYPSEPADAGVPDPDPDPDIAPGQTSSSANQTSSADDPQ